MGGIAKDYNDLPIMYSHSMSSLRLGRLIDERAKVFSYKDYLLIKLFEEIPKDKVKKYLEMSLDKTALAVLKTASLWTPPSSF